MDDARVKLIQEIKDRAKEIGANPMICSIGKVMKEPEYELPLTAEGVHTCNSKDLLTYILRDEWQYEGLEWYVTSKDMQQMTCSRENKYDRASAAECVRAGKELTMPGAESDREDIMDSLRTPSNEIIF